MAEFLTMSEAEDKFGSKGKTNAALTLGIIGTGLAATQAVVNYVVKNAVDKYGPIIDLFIDKNGNINVDMLGEAAREEIKRMGGFTVGRIKFTDKDVDELVNTFKANKKAN